MTSKRNRLVLAYSLALLFGLPAAAFAGSESGFYLGAGIGETDVEISAFDDNDSAYKAFGGYNFGVVPFLDVAVEASYVDFGNPASGLIDIDITGVNAFGLVGFKLGPVGLFAKAGLINWDSEISIGSIREDESGTDPAYGAGARIQIGSFAVRAEYELYDVNVVKDLSMISASVVYTF